MFTFISQEGKPYFAPLTKQRLLEHVKNHEGTTYDITPRKSKRTLSQNSYYWVYLDVIANETGNDRQDLHLFFRKLLPLKKVTIKGKKKTHDIQIAKSTTELDKVEFGEYLDKICALVDIPLPDPIEAGYFIA